MLTQVTKIILNYDLQMQIPLVWRAEGEKDKRKEKFGGSGII